MSHILTLIAENIFVIIGFALYGALVYYMFTRVLNRHFGKKLPNMWWVKTNLPEMIFPTFHNDFPS